MKSEQGSDAIEVQTALGYSRNQSIKIGVGIYIKDHRALASEVFLKVKGAEHPLQAIFPIRGETQFLSASVKTVGDDVFAEQFCGAKITVGVGLGTLFAIGTDRGKGSKSEIIIELCRQSLADRAIARIKVDIHRSRPGIDRIDRTITLGRS